MIKKLLPQCCNKAFVKFVAILALFLGYFMYLNAKFSFETGLLLALITWSFFVLATPIADAGFLLDFPLRVILGIRMFVSEIFVWIAAILINVIALTFNPAIYQSTFLTALFHKILLNPYPYWAIIILSGIGTFLSLIVGDEIMDVISKRKKSSKDHIGFKIKIAIFIVVLLYVIIAYYHLLDSLGVDIESLA